MNRPYVSCPAGVKPTASHASSVIAARASVRAATRTRKRSSTSAGDSDAVAATQASLNRPMSLRTCGCDSSSISTSGAASPSSIDSVPAMCATTALTSQPGRFVGRDQSASSRPASSESMLAQTSVRRRRSFRDVVVIRRTR